MLCRAPQPRPQSHALRSGKFPALDIPADGCLPAEPYLKSIVYVFLCRATALKDCINLKALPRVVSLFYVRADWTHG